MHVVPDSSSPVERLRSKERRLSAVRGQPPPEQELKEQLESVLAFADFCNYLTDGRVTDHADPLVHLAEALYSETTDDLRRGADRG